MTDKEILAKPWHEDVAKNDNYDFVFLSVDVIGHSKLFTEGMPHDELLKWHNVLAALRDYVKDVVGKERADELEWDWAGDGGIFAFLASDPHLETTNKAFLKALAITEGLSHFKVVNVAPGLDLRIVLTHGKAYYYEKKELRRAPALNFAAKLRVPGYRTSITITSDVLKNITCRAKSNFRRIEMGDPDGPDVYGYVPLMVETLDLEIKETKDHAQAAHLAYKLGIIYFMQGNRRLAVKAFTTAIKRLKSVGSQYRYFHRALLEFYGLWHRLATDAPKTLLGPEASGKHLVGHRSSEPGAHLTMLRSSEFKTFRDSHELRGAWQLLAEMELILEQLDVLASSPVNDPIGLTSLEICLLLERVGYPRRWYGTAVHERIQRIKAEMLADEEKTVDEGCSICSSVAASCLILNDDQVAVRPLLKWLRDLADKRYSWRRMDRFAGAPKGNHALHYAAMALQAFVDHGPDEEGPDITNILRLFFEDASSKPGSLPDKWTQHLNTSRYDFSTYVFHALARYRLAGGPLDKTQTEILREAMRTVAHWLRVDALDAGLDEREIGRIYPTRESMGSLALGLLIDAEAEVDEIVVSENLRRFAAYAATDATRTVRARTIDSNLDRIRKMLEGWLLQIESALYRREQEWDIPGYLTQWLGISTKRGLGDSRRRQL